MAAKQNKLFEVCVKGIVCLMKLIAEIDTDAQYVYFVRRILSYVHFCIFNEFSFSALNSAFFQLMPQQQQQQQQKNNNCITTKSFCQN